jgi:hypothetical protein
LFLLTKSPFQNSSSPSSISTVRLFGLLVLASLVLVWANNEFVMTKGIFLALAGDRQETFQVEMQYETVQRMAFWGYGMAPLQTAFRIGFVALVAQMTCLLGGIEIPFGRVFRISATAFWAILFGSSLQILWIAKQPAAAITRASLGIAPDSLAAWLLPQYEAPSLLYHALSRASITSFVWMLLLYWGLRETGRVRPAGAAVVTTATWLVVSTLSLGTTIFVQELVG